MGLLWDAVGAEERGAVGLLWGLGYAEQGKCGVLGLLGLWGREFWYAERGLCRIPVSAGVGWVRNGEGTPVGR